MLMAARWLLTGWNIFEWFSAWFFLLAILCYIHEHGNQIKIWTRDRDWAMAWSNWSAIYNQMSKCNLQRFQKSKWSFLFPGHDIGSVQCVTWFMIWKQAMSGSLMVVILDLCCICNVSSLTLYFCISFCVCICICICIRSQRLRLCGKNALISD